MDRRIFNRQNSCPFHRFVIFNTYPVQKSRAAGGCYHPQSPLRTVLAPFNTHGSGISKAIPSFAFLSGEDYANYLAKKYLSEVCPLSCRANPDPVSAPLQHGLCFLVRLSSRRSRHPLPAFPSAHLAAHFPRREEYGFAKFRINTNMNRSGLVLTLAVPNLR